jgi:hypothetical protein
MSITSGASAPPLAATSRYLVFSIAALILLGCGGASTLTIVKDATHPTFFACKSADKPEQLAACDSPTVAPNPDPPFVRWPAQCDPAGIQQIVITNMKDAHPTVTFWCPLK